MVLRTVNAVPNKARLWLAWKALLGMAGSWQLALEGGNSKQSNGITSLLLAAPPAAQVPGRGRPMREKEGTWGHEYS